MDKVRLALILLTVGIITGPVIGVALSHHDNLMGLIVPNEVIQLADNAFGEDPNEDPSEFDGVSSEPIHYVDSHYDSNSHTISASFNFTNPLHIDLNLKQMSAEVLCSEHGFPLGHAVLDDSIHLSPNEAAIITVNVELTTEAVNHFDVQHPNADVVSVDLTNLTVNVSGISIELDEKITIPEVPLR